MNKLNVEYLKNSGEFKPVKALRFNEIVSFVFENIKHFNFYTLFYLAFNILFLAMLTGQIIHGFTEKSFSFATFRSFLPAISWGLVTGSFFIIPVHEGLHALAFLLLGARKIKFGADLKQMLFYATAENFVGGRKGFTMVALTPFLIINLACLPFAVSGGPNERLFITTMLLFHNIMCIGDFSMLSFFSRNKEKELYTFDDLETKTAWFYERIKR